jgi:predicted acylesterase/phospholipase RssA
MPLKCAAILLILAMFATGARGQQPDGPINGHSAPLSSGSALPPVVPTGRPAVGLALEGGGALGLAHIGVLAWLEEHHIPIDRLSGTSMGALVAGLYASGRTPADMRAIAVSDAFLSVFTLQTPYADMNFRRRQDRREMSQAITLGLNHGIQARNAPTLVDVPHIFEGRAAHVLSPQPPLNPNSIHLAPCVPPTCCLRNRH